MDKIKDYKFEVGTDLLNITLSVVVTDYFRRKMRKWYLVKRAGEAYISQRQKVSKGLFV